MTRQFLKALFKPINTSAVVILGLFTMLWGSWVAAPWWHVFTRAPVYSYMLSLAPEWVWGTVAIVAGIVMILGVFANSYRSLALGSWIGGMHWLVISVLYFIGDWQNTAGITVMAFAVYSAYIHLNLKINRKHFEGTVE